MFKPPSRELLRIENCWRLKKGYPRPTRCCLFSRCMNFSCKKWHALQSEKYSVTQALKWCQGFSDFQNWQKIGAVWTLEVELHVFIDRGRFKHCKILLTLPASATYSTLLEASKQFVNSFKISSASSILMHLIFLMLSDRITIFKRLWHSCQGCLFKRHSKRCFNDYLRSCRTENE